MTGFFPSAVFQLFLFTRPCSCHSRIKRMQKRPKFTARLTARELFSLSFIYIFFSFFFFFLLVCLLVSRLLFIDTLYQFISLILLYLVIKFNLLRIFFHDLRFHLFSPINPLLSHLFSLFLSLSLFSSLHEKYYATFLSATFKVLISAYL